MTVGAGIVKENFFTIAFSFYIFAMVTLLVLMIMDVMECFLHALRLHWYLILIIFLIFLGLNFKVSFLKEEVENSMSFHLSNVLKKFQKIDQNDLSIIP